MQATGLLHGSRNIAYLAHPSHALLCGSAHGFFPRLRERDAEAAGFFDVLIFSPALGFFKRRLHHTTVVPGLTSRWMKCLPCRIYSRYPTPPNRPDLRASWPTSRRSSGNHVFSIRC